MVDAFCLIKDMIHNIYILMCVALPPTHVGGCTLYVGRSTMDDGLLKIVDFEGKLMILG